MNENITKDIHNQIDSFINEYTDKNEFEISFYKDKGVSDIITSERINNLNVVLNTITQNNEEKYKTKNETTLDISLSIKNEKLTNYRITITGINEINEYLKMFDNRKNEIIFSLLISIINEKENIKIIKKVKDFENYISISDYYLKIKMDKELQVNDEELKKLKNIKKNFTDYSIIYRLKQRTTYYIPKSKNVFQIDITNVKQTYFMKDIEKSIPNTELELECLINDKKTFKIEMFKICEFIIKSIQQSNIITTKTQWDNVLKHYRSILNVDEKETLLYGRKPVSLEVHHVIDDLVNKYAVTDKADGERNLMIVYENNCYLISTNLIVKNLGLETKYNNSIVDGEYIYIPKYKKYLFMIFDCLVINGENLREQVNFFERIEKTHLLIEDINKTKYKYNNQIETKNINDLLEYNKNEIIKFYDDIDDSLKKSVNMNVIRRKYFLEPTGLTDNDIFKLTFMMWNLYETDSKLKCPYLLDGLIFQGLNQKYTTIKSENKYPEYKWKPPTRNSIDFYIEFEKDPKTKKILVVFDNSNLTNDEDNDITEGKLKDKYYQICNLYLGERINNIEKPVTFNRNKKLSQCYLYLDDTGFIRSDDGKIINDKTVVEFYYDMNENIPVYLRWVPLKTRYDKTERVLKQGVGYGNSYFVGQNIWNSIQNSVLISNFEELTDDKKYYKSMEELRKRINIKKEVIEEEAYYNVKTIERNAFRKFQNWLKSILIYTYVNAYYNNESYHILEFSCGKNAEIEKYYYATIWLMVGIDIDLHGLINSRDGAISRYDKFKKKQRNYPPMHFIHSTPTNLLTYDEQLKKIGKMSPKMKQEFDKFFPKYKFDRIHCGFAIHYYFDTEESWNNVCININNHLRDGGYFMFETFDNTLLKEKFKENDKYSLYLTINGEKTLITELVKKYDEKNKSPFGNAIDNYMSWISTEYLTEYIVDKDFIISSLKEQCNLELVETGLFKDLYKMGEKYLKYSSKYDYDAFNIKRSKDAYAYYEDTEENKLFKEITFLNRFYVFKKTEPNLKEVKNKYYGKGISAFTPKNL